MCMIEVAAAASLAPLISRDAREFIRYRALAFLNRIRSWAITHFSSDSSSSPSLSPSLRGIGFRNLRARASSASRDRDD